MARSLRSALRQLNRGLIASRMKRNCQAAPLTASLYYSRFPQSDRIDRAGDVSVAARDLRARPAWLRKLGRPETRIPPTTKAVACGCRNTTLCENRRGRPTAQRRSKTETWTSPSPDLFGSFIPLGTAQRPCPPLRHFGFGQSGQVGRQRQRCRSTRKPCGTGIRIPAQYRSNEHLLLKRLCGFCFSGVAVAPPSLA